MEARNWLASFSQKSALQKLRSTDSADGEKNNRRHRHEADASGLSAVNIAGSSQGKKELREKDAWDKLGYSYPTYKKWAILTVMFFIQISINLNASLYANGVSKIAPKFGVSEQAARVPQLTFLVFYALGCQLWAPWSEEKGRWGVQQLSLLLVNIWQIPCALAPNYATLVVCRGLGGLSTAGGSVTLGVIADMWLPDDQEYAVAFLVLSSVGGSVVGAVVGGFLEEFAPLIWIFWTQLAFGGLMQLIHFFCVPETRSTIILDREAKKRREEGEEVYGPNEVNSGLSSKEFWTLFFRSFQMLWTEPIVAWLSAVSGFSDNLIFIFLQSFSLVYKQYNFSPYQVSLAFLPLLAGYFIAYLSFLPFIHNLRQKRKRFGSKSVLPEKRLWWLLFVIWFEPIGLMIFAWTSYGPEKGIPYIAPMIGTALVGIANYSIYQSSIEYTIASYGVYAASATGGNDFARDFLSGIAALYSVPLYENISKSNPYQWASFFLAMVSILVVSPIIYFYRNGERIRKASKFAARIAEEREAEENESQKEKKGGGHSHIERVTSDDHGPDDAEWQRKKRNQQKNKTANMPDFEAIDRAGGPMSKRVTASKRTTYL